MGSSGFRTTSAFMRAFDLFVQQDGGSFLNEDGTPAFNNQHGINALEYLNKLYRTQAPAGAAPLDESAIDAFIAGKSGMAIMGSYDAVATALQTGNTEMQKFTKVIPPFKGNNSDGKPVSFFDGDMMFMSALSKHKQAAWDFIKYFYEPEVFMTYVEANKVVPIYRSQMNSEYMQSHPLLQGIMEMQKYGGTLAATPAYRSARGYLADEIEKTIESGQSAQKSLDNAEKAWLREIKDLK
jgi:ABC-type glycerol-3-phosphate transport system substrate-binding protein